MDGMLDAGAAGYVLKDLIYEQLIPAIHAVIHNRMYISPDIHCAATEVCS